MERETTCFTMGRFMLKEKLLVLLEKEKLQVFKGKLKIK